MQNMQKKTSQKPAKRATGVLRSSQCLCSALLLAVTQAVSADVNTLSGQDRQQQIDTIAALSQTVGDSSNLRCWQYGKLLFEEKQLQGKKLSSDNRMLVFENESGQARQLYLIDIGSATCLFEQL